MGVSMFIKSVVGVLKMLEVDCKGEWQEGRGGL